MNKESFGLMIGTDIYIYIYIMYSEYYDCILNVIYMLVCAAGQK